MSDVSLRHVSKVYPGGVVAVNDFSLEIKDKEWQSICCVAIGRIHAEASAV